MRTALIFSALLLLATPAYSQEPAKAGTPPAVAPAPAAAPKPAAPPMPVIKKTMDVPKGSYKIDPTHTSVIFRVAHMGISHYTARFTKVDGNLEFEPANPTASSVAVNIDPASLKTSYPLPAPDFDKELCSDKWLNTAQFPTITFHSKTIEVTGTNTANITGDLMLHGVTHPVTLATTFNGGYGKMPMDPKSAARVGFSAKGTLKRSDFGVSMGIPAAGSDMGVADEVEIIIETEFTQPEVTKP